MGIRRNHVIFIAWRIIPKGYFMYMFSLFSLWCRQLTSAIPMYVINPTYINISESAQKLT